MDTRLQELAKVTIIEQLEKIGGQENVKPNMLKLKQGMPNYHHYKEKRKNSMEVNMWKNV